MSKTNLLETWLNLKNDAAKTFKENYYATLLNIGANGKSRFKVSEPDLEKNFKNVLIDLVASRKEERMEYSSLIKIYEKGAWLDKKPKYTILISHEEDSPTVLFILLGGKKNLFGKDIDVNDPKNADKFSYELPRNCMMLISSWKEILDGFGKVNFKYED